MPLVLSPNHARSVIECSEGASGLGGGHVGHTKQRHVQISRNDLIDRMGTPDPHGRNNGKVFWRAAFLDITSCADLLARTLAALSDTRFVQDFNNLADGTLFPSADAEARSVDVGAYDCRDWRGRARAAHTKIFMQKYRDRPGGLHLITFYPHIPMPGSE